MDVVRGSGGNNSERHLLIAGYATDVELTCDALFHMPADPAGRCAVSVHYYTPSVFAIPEEDADWGKCRSTWGTEADFKELQKYMEMIETNFIAQGIPVIMGEYGCPKNNKDEESVRLFLTSVCEAAYDRQICPILWDITGVHYDRGSCKMTDSLLQEGLMENLRRFTRYFRNFFYLCGMSRKIRVFGHMPIASCSKIFSCYVSLVAKKSLKATTRNAYIGKNSI